MSDRKSYMSSDEIMVALDAEDERQKEALRKFYQRERPSLHITGEEILEFMFWLIVIGAGAFIVLWSWWSWH